MTTAVVDQVRLSVLEEPLCDPVPMSIGILRARRSLLVEVSVDGVWGVGEVWVNHPSWAAHERLLTFRHGVVPLLAGRDVSDPRGVLHDLARALLPGATQAGSHGPVWQALSGLDIALWDALARRRGCSVAKVLNPEVVPRAQVPVYASGIGPSAVEQMCEQAARQGVRAVKVRVGFGRATDVATLTAVRSVLGDGITLLADANRAWTLDDAVEMSAVLSDQGAAWVEEPLRDDGAAELAALASRTDLPIACGENLYGHDAFEHYLAKAGLAVIQPDPAKSGGLTTSAAVARSAAARGVHVAPHCYSGGVALAASVHLAAAYGSVSMVEVDVRPSALRTRLLDEPWDVRDGCVELPRAPGLGVQVDPGTRRRFLLAEEEHVVGRTAS